MFKRRIGSCLLFFFRSACLGVSVCVCAVVHVNVHIHMLVLVLVLVLAPRQPTPFRFRWLTRWMSAHGHIVICLRRRECTKLPKRRYY